MSISIILSCYETCVSIVSVSIDTAYCSLFDHPRFLCDYSNFPAMDKLEKGPKEIFSPEIQKVSATTGGWKGEGSLKIKIPSVTAASVHVQDLLLLEEQEGSVNFKFGVLYTRPSQLTDDEMLSNGKPLSVHSRG